MSAILERGLTFQKQNESPPGLDGSSLSGEESRRALPFSERSRLCIEALSGAAVMSDQTTVTAVPRGPSKVSKLLPWIIAVAFGLLSIGLLPFAISSFRQTPARESVIRSAILAPENATYFPFNQFALSPDGQWLAFVARGAGGQNMLWLRPLNASTAQPLAGTDGASPSSPPFWSPNSASLGSSLVES